MTDPLISVSVPDTASLSIYRVFKALADITESDFVLKQASSVLLNRIRNRFLREVDPSEYPWVPSKAGIARRATGGTGTLFDTGRLFRSIQQAEINGNETRITTDVPYAKYHQNGIGQVQRIFMGINENDALVVERVLQRLIDKALGI
jgi:phage gpG-like protein